MTHAAIFSLVLSITARMPAPTTTSPRGAAGVIVWMPSQPQGGGKGDGDRTPEPARRAEAPGRDRTTVAVRRRPSADARPSRPVPQIPAVDIDAVATAAGITEMPGMMAAVPSASNSLGPGDGTSAGAGRMGGSGSGDGSGLGPGLHRGRGGGPFAPGAAGVSSPRLIREVAPLYTNGAVQARIEGVVFLTAIVRADGSVADVQVTRSLDRSFGLDEEALRVVKLWRFIPAMQSGRPVDAVVPIEIRFTIR